MNMFLNLQQIQRLANKFLCYCFILCSISNTAFTQPDNFVGKWKVDIQGNFNSTVQLHIAPVQQGILYPAQLTIQCDSFMATYELLLAKKSTRELAISKNKFSISEAPFSINKATFYFNGILDYSRDLKGYPTLQLARVQQKFIPQLLPDTSKMNVVNKKSAIAIFSMLQSAAITFTKQSNIPLKIDAQKVISPAISNAYYGIMDTVHVQTRDGKFSISSNKKTDIATASCNGKMIVEEMQLGKKPFADDFLLDTGLNTIVLFADNFGSGIPNASRLQLEYGKKKLNIDFNRLQDSAATFIVARLYIDKDKEKETSFQEYIPVTRHLNSNQVTENVMGSLVSTAQQLKLAIWDDAVEDGDSISINVNGKWVAKGFPVKKNPQFLTIPLKPGDNSITFVADNLGSIAPNTSVIEIIDGKKRKSFMLETVMGQNNIINILYNSIK
jgi:hypothetical protein